MNVKRSLKTTVSILTATTALLLGTALAAPAQAIPADGKGELVVTTLDGYGKPLASGVTLTSTAGDSEGSFFGQGAVTRQVSLNEGRYGLVGMAPWGGLFCAGVSPCSYLNLGGGTPALVTGVVNVTDVETPTSYTFRAPKPATVTGSSKVGSILSVNLSTEMKNLGVLLSQAGGQATVQWLRNGTVIPGATGTTYQTSGADVAKTISPRLSYPDQIAVQFGGIGMNAEPLTLPGIKVAKGKTRTTVEVFRKAIAAGKSTSLRADVTTGALPAAGKVKITIGRWKVTKNLRNGSVRVPVPKTLRPGTYQVVATYLGTSSLSGSTGTDKLTVTRR